MAGNEPLLIACRQGPTVSVNLQVLLLVAGRASLVNNKGGVMAVRACALSSCALLHDLALPHQPCIPLTLGAGGGACMASRLSGLQLHLVQAGPGKLCCCTLRSTRTARH